MGEWGYLSHQSDETSDMQIGVDEAINAHLRLVFNDRKNLTYRKCTGLVVSLLRDHEIDEEFVELALQCAARELELIKVAAKPPKEAVKLISLTVACLVVVLQNFATIKRKTSFKKNQATCKLPVEIDRNFFIAKRKFQFEKQFIANVKKQLTTM